MEMTNKERWRAVDGYYGYLVSSNGRIFSEKTGKFLKQKKETNGYMLVVLSENGMSKTHLVHRLVATAFLENKDGKPQVNHIDSDRSNNKLSNLEWVTASENLLHGVEAGRVTGPINRGRRVDWIHQDGRSFYGTPTMLARRYPEEKLSRANLFHVLHGNRKTHKKWRVAC